MKNTKQAALTYRVMMSLLDVEQLNEALSGTLDIILESLSCELGAVWLLDEESGMLKCVISAGEVDLTEISVENGIGAEGIATLTGQSVSKPAMEGAISADGCIFDEVGVKTRTLLCVPLNTTKKYIGCIAVANKTSGEFYTAEELDLLEKTAALAALTIEEKGLVLPNHIHGRTIISLRDIRKDYPSGDTVLHVLKGINLDIYEGEIVTLLGPSGCGKTTILRTIGGFLDVTSGDITIDGQSIVNMPPEKRPTAMVFQSYNLWPHMTIYENLSFGLNLRKIPKDQQKEDITKMLAMVSMSGVEKKFPGQLSGGQQQRIAIARSLLLKPSLLLLDEPFSALDAKIRQQMREELKKIQSDLGITVVFVTHDQEEAMALSHRIVVMNKGKFEQVGTPTEIYDNPASRYVASFIGEMNFIDMNGKTYAVRPENLLFTGDGELSGILETQYYLGDVDDCRVRIGSTLVRVITDGAAYRRMQKGQKVRLTVRDLMVFPDDGSLEEKLKIRT